VRRAARPVADDARVLRRRRDDHSPADGDREVRELEPAHRGLVPSKSLYWHTFGSLTNALREAGFDVPVGEERLERAIEQGEQLAQELGRLPRFADWSDARRADPRLLSEWQVYRMFDARRGAWSTFQFLIRDRLLERGIQVGSDGTLRS
jgi:hypothetical protein